jgi:hypothetical protein
LPRPNWSRALRRPLDIPKVMTLKTLADARALIEGHLPQHFRAKPTWCYVAARLAEAAHGGDTLDVAVPLQIALSMEGVEYHLARRRAASRRLG